MSFKNQVWIVTGASRGLGLELADRLAQRGARLVLVARQEEALLRAARRLEKQAELLAIAADVSEAAEEIVARAWERFGRLDGLINNASTVGPSPMPELAQYPWQALERVLRVNLLAPLHLTQLALRGRLRLSERESQVLGGIGRGLSNRPSGRNCTSANAR